MTPDMIPYNFTEDWFSKHAALWNALLRKLKPSKILEIGCYEGNATCFLSEVLWDLPELSITCIDPWEQYTEKPDVDFGEVEKRFDENIKVALTRKPTNLKLRKLKGTSEKWLPQLMVEGEQFDFIYVDGAHDAPTVLFDAVMAFRLVKPNGIIVFDDWGVMPPDLDESSFDYPRMAIEFFLRTYAKKLGKVNFTAIVDGKMMQADSIEQCYQCFVFKKES